MDSAASPDYLQSFLTVAERYGLAFAVMLAVIIAGGFALRELWKVNNSLQAQITETMRNESAARQALREAYERQMEAYRAEMERRTAEYITHLNSLQEKRAEAAATMTREVMQLAAEIRDATRQQTDSIGYLRDMIRRDQ